MESEDEASREHLAAKEVARAHEAEVKAAHGGRQTLVKVCMRVCVCVHVCVFGDAPKA